MPPIRGVGFLGRASECRRLDDMLAHARDGQSAVLVIRGEPGIGKTALLRYAARQASGLRVAQVEGVQAEMELPFSGIHRLCAPMLAGLEVLPEPQQDALRVALGLSSGDAPTGSWSPSPCSTCSPRPPRSARSCAWWTTLSGSTPRRWQALGFVARRLLAEAGGDDLRAARAGHHPRARRPAASCRSRASMSRMRGLCCREPWPAGSTTASATGSSARPRGNPLALLELSQRMSRRSEPGALPRPRPAIFRVS